MSKNECRITVLTVHKSKMDSKIQKAVGYCNKKGGQGNNPEIGRGQEPHEDDNPHDIDDPFITRGQENDTGGFCDGFKYVYQNAVGAWFLAGFCMINRIWAAGKR